MKSFRPQKMKRLIERIHYPQQSNDIIEMKEGNYNINGTEVRLTSKKNIGNLEGSLRNDTIIVSYDSFNPFVSEAVLNKTVEITKRNNATLTVYALPDTIKIARKSGIVKNTPDRSKYRKIQLRSMTYEFFKEHIIKHDFLRKILNIFYRNDLLKRIDNKIKNIIDIIPKY